MTTAPHYTDGPVTVWHGDCIDVMRRLPDASVDAVVTDPPYGLSNTDPGHVIEALTRWLAGDRDYLPSTGGGFMGNSWDAFVPPVAVWDEALRVLKPGGHVLCFAGTRTVDLMTLAIRLAGFEIRDSIAWLYGSGFPKSLDVSKAIDRMAGAEREVIGSKVLGRRLVPGAQAAQTGTAWHAEDRPEYVQEQTAPATADAARWNGWGTALKPAFEPIVVARKPLTGTVAANVLAHGTGALNIDGSRIGIGGGTTGAFDGAQSSGVFAGNDGRIGGTPTGGIIDLGKGRWPANVVLDASQAAALDTQSGEAGGGFGRRGAVSSTGDEQGMFGIRATGEVVGYGDAGGASRFFKTVDTVTPRFRYTAKAGSDERPTYNRTGTPTPGGAIHPNVCALCGRQDLSGSRCECPDPQWVPRGGGDSVSHPTVKPLDLMRWLVKLVTPPGGTVLEPFAGSGTTVEAAVLEGFRCIAIEREGDYLPLILQRIRKPHAVGLDLDWDAPTPAPTPIRAAGGRTAPRSGTPAPPVGLDFGDDWELDA